MPHDGKTDPKGLLCDVCERDGEPEDRSRVFICKACADPKRVRLYFQCCKKRVDLSLQEARNFYSQYGIDIFRTGLVLRYRECPDCAKNDVPPFDTFNIRVPNHELEFSSSVALA